MTNKTLDKLSEDYPSVPTEIFEIEESAEVAEMFLDMFGGEND